MISRHGEIGRHAALRRQCLRHLGSNPSGGIFSLLILYYTIGNHSFFVKGITGTGRERFGSSALLRKMILFYFIFSVAFTL